MKIAIVGSGNMAHVLGHNLVIADHEVITILARNSEKGILLASTLNAVFQPLTTPIAQEVELILLCISDDYIHAVSKEIKSLNTSAIVAHTSGSVGINALDDNFSNVGVLYPLQTIRKSSLNSFIKTPICINANNKNALAKLQSLAKSLSKKVYLLSDDERKKAHLAAVIVNNFTNHLVSSAYEYLENENIPIEVIQPLLEETMIKLLKVNPDTTQTGPAIRRDSKTINTHLNMLVGTSLQEIYKNLTISIQQKHLKP